MNKFIKLFISQTNYKITNINLQKINYYQGLNNSSCFIETSDGVMWQIKISINKEKSIKNEIKFLNKYWFKKFYHLDSSFIKEMKKGEKTNIQIIFDHIEELARVINKFHLPKIKNQVDYFKYLNPKLSIEDLKTFRTLLEQHKNQKIVLSHNDINLKNIMINENKLFLVDFEWTKNNYIWFDIINFIREENLRKSQIKKIIVFFPYLENFKITLQFLFINAFFALTWAMELQNNNKKDEYLLKIKRQLKKIKKWIKDEK